MGSIHDAETVDCAADTFVDTTLDLDTMDEVVGGGEGLMTYVRAGLVGVSLLTGSPNVSAPSVRPIQIVQSVAPVPLVGR